MSSRYYEDKEAEIVPGKISDELRAALNLAENDIPIWIYRMRALGYPPGWLNKAIVDTSDIFDTDVPKEGESTKRKDAPIDNIQYDHSKLIEYPGFNSPLPKDANDYHYYHNMPPMLPHQQLDYAKKTMCEFKPAPLPSKRVRTSTSSDNNTSINNESTGSIKLISKGSPMPRPVERLPLEKFSEGVVGELLHFENIPDSTGRFESIRGLLESMKRPKS